MTRKYDVIGLGNAIVDVLAPVDDEFVLTHQVVKNAMMLIDEFRAEQLYKAFGETVEAAGGSVANSMAGLASFGGRGKFVGKVKADRLGEAFAKSLTENGTDYTTAPATEGASTACCLIAVPPDAQRAMNTYLGASRELGPDDVIAEDIAAAETLYIEGYLTDSEISWQAALKAAAIAKETGTKIAVTLSDAFCVGRYRQVFLDFLDVADIVFANEEEAKSLFQVEDFDAVLQCFIAWGGIAAITRSAKGCVVTGNGQVHVVDAAPVSQVLDTTGAGDQFAAGFLFGLTHKKSLTECGKLGALAAAEVISHFGARPEVSLKALAEDAGLV
ncbi:sugar/nucleoside kinase (ribokinase family) [Rhizomicrobium palustre]|uniref:Sugar/nucleoside kinase (Ribokinase family) n=1 Tax=Rhizomicrobium palustre TaxID=189966 RepID=A0A846MY53_9PROT|nr:adenosine kinase [Rhizomicrobium palustre]NIK88169.1 sugar/nucleoside kinase (ribokinase family) [Rhizomicrobium palustre]